MLVQKKSEAKRVATMGFRQIYDPVAPYLEALDRFLQEQLNALEPEIREHAAYVFGHSGKRLRPLLVAFSGWAHESPEHNPDLVKLGAVIELVHLATLVHDDILDGASMRHRQATAASKFGPADAVLIGDALFAHALTLAASFPTTEVCRIVARATSRVCAGEIAQTLKRGEVNHDLERYFRVINLKTAELFRVSCQLGAGIGGHSAEFAKAAGAFGMHLGIAYQIFDDLADLLGTEEEIGKTLGTDLASGKFTLPTLLLLSKATPADQNQLLEYAFNKPSQAAALFTAKLAEYPVENEVRAYFEHELNAAFNAIAPFEELAPYAYLRSLADFVSTQIRDL